MPHHGFKQGTPSRQGFYKAETEDGAVHIAEWKEYDKKQGKRWWVYQAPEPTLEKTPALLAGVVVAHAKVSEEEVQSALRRELTRQEKIEASYAMFLKGREGGKRQNWFMPIPANRQLSVGQEVLVGLLADARVVDFREDGQVVIVEYAGETDIRGQATGAGTYFSTHVWLDVLPKVPLHEGLTAKPRLTQPEMVTQLRHLVHRIYREGASDVQDYQREYVWTAENKEMYYDTLFKGRNLGRFIFVVDFHTAQIEVLDGKQRLNAIVELMGSVVPYKGVFWHQIAHDERVTVLHRTAQFVDLNKREYSRADLLQIFLEVNAGGVPQTPAHLAHVQALLDAELAKERGGV